MLLDEVRKDIATTSAIRGLITGLRKHARDTSVLPSTFEKAYAYWDRIVGYVPTLIYHVGDPKVVSLLAYLLDTILRNVNGDPISLKLALQVLSVAALSFNCWYLAAVYCNLA